MMLMGMLGVSCSNPPWTYTVESTDQQAWRNLCRELNLYHSEDSVSYTSKGTISPTWLVLPPITIINGPRNRVECWYLGIGYSLVCLYGALTQSHLPSLCLLRPQLSFKLLWSAVLPPKHTIIPVALPVWHKAAEWYTLTAGFSFPQSSLIHEKGAFSTLRHHTSLTASWPVFPPNTNRWGLEKTIVWPYLLPGVDPTTGTIIHYAISSPFLISSRYRSSDAKLPPILLIFKFH